MATAYHRDQVGAPALVYSGAPNVVAHFTALKAILKACLISGYGALPAAGWELIAEGTNYIVLRPGSHSGYVCLTWVSGGVVRVYLSETYTGMSGDVMVGDGLKTGLAASNALPQVISATRLASASAISCWTLVADARTFVLSMVGDTTNLELAVLSNTGFTLFAGEDSEGNLLALGGNGHTSTNPTSAASFFTSTAGMTALKNPATGLLVGAGALDAITPGLARTSTVGQFSQIIPLPTAQLLAPRWFGGGAEGGFLRGVAGVPELAFSAAVSQAAQSLGRVGPMTIRDANTPIDLADGHTYFARIAHSSSDFFLLTDNPAFW